MKRSPVALAIVFVVGAVMSVGALVLVTTGGAGLLAGRRAGARTATVDGALLGPAATTR
jgi:hypothetical protein